MPLSNWLTIGELLKTQIAALPLTNLPVGRVYLRKKLDPRGLTFPCIVIAYQAEESSPSATAKGVYWDYPYQVGIFSTKLADLAPSDEELLWRELIRDYYHGYPLSGVPNVPIVIVDPGVINDTATWQEQNLDLSILNIIVQVKVSRPSRVRT